MLNKKDIVEEINDQHLFMRKISKKDAEFLFVSLKQKAVNRYLSLGPLSSLEHAERLIDNYLQTWSGSDWAPTTLTNYNTTDKFCQGVKYSRKRV